MNGIIISSNNNDRIVNEFLGFYPNCKIEEWDETVILYLNGNVDELAAFLGALNNDLLMNGFIYVSGNTNAKRLGLELYLINAIKRDLPKGVYTASEILKIADEKTRNDFLNVVLKDFIEDEQFINLLENFFQANLNISETALRVYMHRNTVIYKLSSFKSKTGIDLHNFCDSAYIFSFLNKK